MIFLKHNLLVTIGSNAVPKGDTHLGQLVWKAIFSTGGRLLEEI
jgi:hypothetical protein